MKILNYGAITLLAICLLCVNSGAIASVVNGSRIMDQDMNENLCALTFDDGPSIYTPALLDMLSYYGIPATFFMLGQQARRYPDIVRRVVAEGHEIGNHSWSHPNLKKLTLEEQYEQLNATNQVLHGLGAVPFLMRPPYGAFDERTEHIAEEMDLSIILWSMDSYDWKRLPADYSQIRSTRGTIYENGSMRGIFLFHDIHKATVDDLPRIIMQLRDAGCQKFVTVSEYLKGISDPEPAMLMSRHSAPPAPPLTNQTPVRVTQNKSYIAGSGPMPLARCSKPWSPTSKEQDPLELDNATAAFDNGMETRQQN